jgi:hypothetical protein
MNAFPPALFALSLFLATPLLSQEDVPLHQVDIAAMVRQGRSLLAEGKGSEARTILEQADALDGGALRTRMWLVRAMIEINYLNDALDMTDDLVGGGASGSDVDYLYGMAFVYKARKYIGEGVNLSMVGMHFSDAVAYLSSATDADAEKYGDAFLPLAEAAWNCQQLDLARGAAERAAALPGSGPNETMMLGEIAFSQFVVANADEAQKEVADAHWQRAYDAFRKTCEREGKPTEPTAMSRLARAHKKCGDTLVWKSRLDEAAAQYARSIGWAPTSIDYAQLLSNVGEDKLLPTLEEGAKNFTRHHRGEKTSVDATLQWWLGWARFSDKEYATAAEAFDLAYSKWPAYQDCLWYIGLCRFNLQEYDAAAASMLESFRIDPDNLAASISGRSAFHLSIVESLVGHCVGEGRLVDAAMLSEAQAIASPQTTRYWNNCGLFYRDAGDSLARSEKETGRELRRTYYEKALARYEVALSLEPLNPAYLNDTAVVLHYNLDRDLDRALAMYKLSFERAGEELARTDITPEDRDLYQIALRDSRNNKRLLERELERRRRAEEEEQAKKEEAGGDAGSR